MALSVTEAQQEVFHHIEHTTPFYKVLAGHAFVMAGMYGKKPCF